MSSLSGRLLLFVSLLLVVFFGLTIFVLDFAFRDLSERSLRELLDAQLMGLVAASDADEQGNVRPLRQLADPRFGQPGSGLYAHIRSADGELLWWSASSLGTEIDFGERVPVGQRRVGRLQIRANGNPSQVMALSAGFRWEIAPGEERDLVFSVATSLGPYELQLQRFRSQLLGWFLALIALLVIAMAFLLRMVLSPLRRIEREIREVEAGTRDQLGVALPSELVGLATNMNALLTSERKRLERYRNTLGNLAHSLKTPLAVIRSSLSARRAYGSDTGAIDRQIDREIERMDGIVQHQLKRAAASGGSAVGRAAVEVEPLLVDLRTTLRKVYASKDLLFEIEATPGVVFVGDRGDLLELAGNLLDNACKWSRSHIRVRAVREPASDGRPRLLLTVEDDGPGIASEDRTRVLERGARADEQTAGQGIGLAMVREIVELYGGDLAVEESSLGGARFAIHLPGR